MLPGPVSKVVRNTLHDLRVSKQPVHFRLIPEVGQHRRFRGVKRVRQLHWIVATSWLAAAWGVATGSTAVHNRAVAEWWTGETPNGKAPVFAAGNGVPYLSFLHRTLEAGPFIWFGFTPTHNGLWGFFLLTGAAFWLAYTVGAACKMVSFGAGHEIAHETIHPWLSVLPSTPNGASHGDAAARGSWGHMARTVLKDLALRAVCLPSFFVTIYEYYHGQHLAHHRHLGDQDVGEAFMGLMDGTMSGDGDALAVNTLLFRQRMDHSYMVFKPEGGIPDGKAFDRHSFGYRKLSAKDRRDGFIPYTGNSDIHKGEPVHIRPTYKFESVKTAFLKQKESFARGTVLRFIAEHTVWGKLLTDPLLHIGHLGLMGGSSAIHSAAFLAWAVVFVVYLAWGALPECARRPLRARAMRFSNDHFKGATLTHASMLKGLKAAWHSASIGIQNVLFTVVLVMMYRFFARHPATMDFPIVPWLGSVFYLILSEMFVFGFLFHPFLTYFLSVHQSAETADGGCQPTRSIYSPSLSLFTMNLTYHTEHHDFPSVPWYYLPRITTAAPKYYNDGARNAAFGSWVDVLWGYLHDTDTFVYGCATEFGRHPAPRWLHDA